jgi:3-deoxy-D-manno-octulosonic-acid transferase
MHSQPELLALMQESGAGKQVVESQLPETLLYYLKNPEEAKRMGEKGKRLIAAMQGTTQRTWDALRTSLHISKEDQESQ